MLIFTQKIKIIGSDGKTYYNAFYGKGYVQLTWKENYKKMGEKLGFGDKLLTHPELVLKPEIAYKIMSYGMRHGSFTGKKLADYINDKGTDYKNARRIINGLDKWRLIRGYAVEFEDILKESIKAAETAKPTTDTEISAPAKQEEIVRTVAAEKTYFYNEPEEDAKTDVYIIKGDKVIEANPDFVFVRFEGTKTFDKWVKREDLE